MTHTIFRPVAGYDDLYAGMDGTIISGEKGRELKQTLRQDGYPIVRIPNIKQELVHRLVASAFFGPCPKGMEVRHGEGPKHDCSIGNLCYGSPKDNTQDAMRSGTHQGAVMAAKTECPEGHPYSKENTYLHPTTGSRHCRACRTAYQKEYRRTHPWKQVRRNSLGDN
jgi:hypothetical protein